MNFVEESEILPSDAVPTREPYRDQSKKTQKACQVSKDLIAGAVGIPTSGLKV